MDLYVGSGNSVLDTRVGTISFPETPYSFARISQVLEGNSNTHEVKKNIIPVIQARYVRLIPLKWHNWTCARMEFYGEPWPEGEIA